MLTRLDEQQRIMLATMFVSGVILAGLMFQVCIGPDSV